MDDEQHSRRSSRGAHTRPIRWRGPAIAAIVLVAGTLTWAAAIWVGSEDDVSTGTVTTSVTSAQEATVPAPTTTRPPTTTAPPTTAASTTPTTRDSEAFDALMVERFVEEFAAALERGDVGFVFDRLHPVVKEGFGVDVCRSWVEEEIMTMSAYGMTASPITEGTQTFVTPQGEATIERVVTVEVAFVFENQSVTSTGGFAVTDDGVFWLGQCR